MLEKLHFERYLIRKELIRYHTPTTSNLAEGKWHLLPLSGHRDLSDGPAPTYDCVPQGKVHGAQAFSAAAILAGTAAFVLIVPRTPSSPARLELGAWHD